MTESHHNCSTARSTSGSSSMHVDHIEARQIPLALAGVSDERDNIDGDPRFPISTFTPSAERPVQNMSALPQERLGSEIVEPDSELRAALQRVARDLEQSSRHQRHRTEGLQHEHSGDALGRIGHQKSNSAQSIHVEDILDQVSLIVLNETRIIDDVDGSQP